MMDDCGEDIVFSLVVYNEFYWEVESFKSLLSSYYKSGTSKSLNVYIFDNTVIQKKNEEPYFEKINIKYLAFGENMGISKSYNYLVDVASNEGFEWIVFLDQDTRLSLDFYHKYIETISELNLKKVDIAVPIVKSGTKILSPSLYKNYRTKLLDSIPSIICLNDYSAINSGLLINCEFFSKVGGYNEELFLDFCDHDFFFKIKQYRKSIFVIDTELQQDFSAETDSMDKALTRYKLFIKDLNSFKRNRNQLVLLFLVDIPHLLKLLLKYKSLKFLKYRLNKK